MCLIMLLPGASFASENSSQTEEILAKVSISGEHIIKNNTSLKTGRHTFVLTADNKANPMPDNSVEGTKEITVTSNNGFSFGEIDYEKQGRYDYTISRKTEKARNLTEDDSVYKALITVFNDGEATIVLQKKGAQGKPDKIVYADKYKGDKKAGKGTQTGDDMNLMLGCLLLLASMSLIITFTARRKE